MISMQSGAEAHMIIASDITPLILEGQRTASEWQRGGRMKRERKKKDVLSIQKEPAFFSLTWLAWGCTRTRPVDSETDDKKLTEKVNINHSNTHREGWSWVTNCSYWHSNFSKKKWKLWKVRVPTCECTCYLHLLQRDASSQTTANAADLSFCQVNCEGKKKTNRTLVALKKRNNHFFPILRPTRSIVSISNKCHNPGKIFASNFPCGLQKLMKIKHIKYSL